MFAMKKIDPNADHFGTTGKTSALEEQAPSRRNYCFPYSNQCSDLGSSHVLHTRAFHLVPESRMWNFVKSFGEIKPDDIDSVTLKES